MAEPKYKMEMSLNVLNHLGLNLYSNVPAVISEVVANSYDADAENVSITIEPDRIIIEDDGCGMTLSEINEKYLYVGYQRRISGNAITPKHKRPVMGRKGIGKLSLFSIAETIELFTVKGGEKNGLRMNKSNIEAEIKSKKSYTPEDIPLDEFAIEEGTRIVITKLKKSVSSTEKFLKRRLARRFSVIGDATSKFVVRVNGDYISAEDRDYLKKVQFLWLIGEEEDDYTAQYKNIKKVTLLPGKVELPDGTTETITGWIGAVEKPSDLMEEKINNNKVSIFCRGKMSQEDILEEFTEGGIYVDYLIGEVSANFLDTDDKDDIATTSRQKIYEEDDRYKSLKSTVYGFMKKIQGEWTDLRLGISKETALSENSALKEWYETLENKKQKKQAEKLFNTIESLHFDKGEEGKKKELYRQGILAFERLRIRDSLDDIDNLNSASDIEFAGIFSDLQDIEAILYHEIATERVRVIRKLDEIVDDNQKEKVIQEHIFDNLWLLSPAWERAIKGTETMERSVTSEFDKVTASLTQEERDARYDIKYRTYSGKHVIVELKRYKTTYKLTAGKLIDQIDKYTNALKKVLKSRGKEEEEIEVICILGKPTDGIGIDELNKKLASSGAKAHLYDALIDSALESYSGYLEREEQVNKLRDILDKL